MVLFDDTVPPPTPLVDGADPITTGTPTNEAWYTDLSAALDAQLHSAADPTKMPADIIEEMAEARGDFDTLNERLEGVVDPSGNPTGLVIPQQIRTWLGYGPVIFNGGHLLWSRGVAAAPDGWTLSGTGAAVAQCGTGQSDTTTTDATNYAAKLTYGSAAARLTQQFAPAAVWDALAGVVWNGALVPVDANDNPVPGYASNNDEMPGLYVMAYVYSNGTNRARISVGEQAGVGSGLEYSEYHPGNGGWRWLIAGPLAPDQVSPTSLNVQAHVENAGSAYFMFWTLMFGRPGLPPVFMPERPVRRSISFQSANDPATGTLFYWSPDKPVLLMGARLGCSAAPTVGACSISVLTPISGSYAAVFATAPDIAATKFTGIQAADPVAANYRRRCIRGIQTDAAAALADNSIVRVDYTDDAGGTTRDLVVVIDYLEFPRPFEQWRTQTDLGE